MTLGELNRKLAVLDLEQPSRAGLPVRLRDKLTDKDYDILYVCAEDGQITVAIDRSEV